MSQIIRKWLAEKLGILLDNNVTKFGNLVKDGNIISQLLSIYGLIKSDDICSISDNYEVCCTNLKCLSDALKIIGIEISNSKIEILANGDGPTAYKLFYQLYLVLHDKSKVDYILKAKLNKEQMEINFPQDELLNKPLETKQESPVTNYETAKAYYQWQKKNNTKQLKHNKELREQYIKKFQAKIKEDILNQKEIDERNCKDVENRIKDMFQVSDSVMNKQEQIALTEVKDGTQKPKEDFKPNLEEANQYMRNLKEKYRKKEENKILQSYMHKLLLSDLHKKFKNKQDKEFNQSITSKLLNQSTYEKQMTRKLLEINNQKDRIIENRIMVNETAAKKRDEEFVDAVTKRKFNVTLASLKDYNERQRILELHKKLYEQKMERKFFRHYEICHKVAIDLVDMAIKISEHVETYHFEVPVYLWNDWVELFIKEQKLLDTQVNLDEVLSYIEEEEDAEIVRQSYLDEKDFENYLHLKNQWRIDELDHMYLTSSEAIKFGENILSHIVSRILLVKYPKPQLPQCPQLPKVFTACVIIGLNNDTHVKILQNILSKRDIILINENEITNYCLQAYQQEGCGDEIDQILDTETTKAKKSLKSNKAPKVPKQDKKGRKTIRLVEGTLVQTYSKETQTPKLFPDEEILLSPQAQLGQYAYESLNLGLTINNYLFTKMLIEYLKSFKTIKGWVLINYPENIADAIALELALTGRDVRNIMLHIDEEIGEGELEESFCSDYERSVTEIFSATEDIFLMKRISKLLPINVSPPEAETYNSYLNSFIRVSHTTSEKSLRNSASIELSYGVDDYTKVENFYDQLNCKSCINYKDFNADIVKEIVNLVMQDKVFGKLIYNEIIQTVFDCLEEKRKENEEVPLKATKPTTKRKEKKSNASDTLKKRKSVLTNIPRTSSNVIQIGRPGDSTWTYVNLPLPNEFQKQLASFWEDIELSYLNDFKQIFFQLRLIKNALVPYYHSVYTQMIDFIQRPDNKQEYLHQFQLAFNNLKNDLRIDDEFKVELHCRIIDFKSKLWDICVFRMREAEDERLKSIYENWYTDMCVETVNLFVSAMQLEIDRYISTMQLIIDYYTFMAINELSLTKLNKINLNSYTADDKIFIFMREAYVNINNKINKTPFTHYLNVVLRNTLQFVNQVYQTVNASTSIMHKLIQEPKISKNKPLALKSKSQEPGDVVTNQKNMSMLNKEWLCAIEGEFARIKFRLALLDTRACQELDEIVVQGEKLYHGIYDKLDKRNQDELQSVNLACEIFHRATEACESVQPRLLIADAKFYMDKTEIMYNDVYQPMLPYLDEITMEVFFTIPQLMKLTQIFFDLAPNGSLPLKTFSYLIQDIVEHQSDTGFNLLMPIYWHNLDTTHVQEVIDQIYGNLEYINWKDFIVYNLELPFPTEHELLDARDQFRLMDPDKLEYVNEEQFNRVQFWFDRTEFIRKTFSKESIKKLLLKMFEIRTDCINYSALLLTFCKDFDPIIGVAKAFGLCVGKLVCWNMETGLNYVEILRYQKFLDHDRIMSHMSEFESQSNCSETKFPSNAEFPKDNVEPLSDDQDSIFVEAESDGEEEAIKPPSLCYILPLNIILTIMTAALPWHSRVQCVQDKSLKDFLEVIYENSRNDEFQLVFTHDFLNNGAFKNYITNNYKFNVRSPASFVQSKIEKCFCRKETLSESDKL